MMITKIAFMAFVAMTFTVNASEPSLLCQSPTARCLQALEDCDTCYNQISGDGTTYLLYPQWFNNYRDYIFCEIILTYDELYGSDVYSTFPIKPCNTTWFDDLNLDDVAALFNASSASKNGPQSWSMDSLQVYASHPVHILVEPICYYGAVLWPARIVANPQPPYMSLYLDKNQQLIWDANKPSYWLTDSYGENYIMLGYKVPKDELDTLGDKFQDLPEG